MNASQDALDLRSLTPGQLKLLGMAALAYVKPTRLNGSKAFSIHAADGTRMAVAPDRTTAFEAITRYSMTPSLVH